MPPTLLAVEKLRADAVDAKPVNYDFGQGYAEDGGWDVVYPSPAELSLLEIKGVLDDVGADPPDPNPWGMGRRELMDLCDDQDGDLDDFSMEDLRSFVADAMDDLTIDGRYAWDEAYRDAMQEEHGRFVPMMNYAYPLPDFHGDGPDAQALLDLHGGPVCLVEIQEEYHLALTGGGMDLSWDICRAYMLLGYLPPAHFAGRLPEYAGPPCRDWEWVLAGAVQATEVAAHWANEARERTARLRDKMTGARDV